MVKEDQNFSMHEGEAKTLDVEEVDDTDIGGETVTWILAEDDSATPELTKDNDSNGGVTIDNGSAGEFEVDLDASDTEGLIGEYYHEARLEDSDVVIMTGEVTIKESATV